MVALSHLEAATEPYDSGILRRAFALASSLLRMALRLLPSPLTPRASLLVLWTRLSVSGIFPASIWWSAWRDLTDTRTRSTPSLSLPTERSLSVVHWTAPSRCGSSATPAALAAWSLTRPESASRRLRVTATSSCPSLSPPMPTGSCLDPRIAAFSSGIPARARRNSCSRVTRTLSSQLRPALRAATLPPVLVT